MKTTFTAIITLLGAFTASATTVTYNFTTPANKDLGSYSQAFVSAPTGYTVTAYGFENGRTDDLYIKDESAREKGLGLAGQNDCEIDKQGVVILDISKLDPASILQLEVSSVDPGEKFAVYGLASSAYNGGTIAPTLAGSALFTGTSTLNNIYFSVPTFSNYKYLALTAPTGNVLLEGVTASFAGSIGNAATPEPATMGFVGLALITLALGGRLRKNKS